MNNLSLNVRSFASRSLVAIIAGYVAQKAGIGATIQGPDHVTFALFAEGFLDYYGSKDTRTGRFVSAKLYENLKDDIGAVPGFALGHALGHYLGRNF